MDNLNPAEIKENPKEIVLYQGLNFKAIIPSSPEIPPEQGLHVQIAGEHDQTDTPKRVLQRFLFALGTAKAVAESELTPDFWANTRIKNGREVHVYGRVPGNEASWRKPVNPPQEPLSLDGFESRYDEEKLKRLFGKYLPLWGKLAEKIQLFTNGVNGEDRNISSESEDNIIWTNGRIEVALAKTYPWQHIPGLHFVVAPVKKITRQWQTILENQDIIDNEKMVQEYIQLTLECAAVAFAVRELVSQGKGEIQNNGNWAKGLKIVEVDSNEGKLSLANAEKNRKKEKRKHFTRIEIRPDGELKTIKESDFGTSSHFHVYIPLEREGAVILPTMWPWEAQQKRNEALINGQPTEEYDQILDRWKRVLDNAPNLTDTQRNQFLQVSSPDQLPKIPTLNDERIKAIIEKLGGGKLNRYLEENFLGSLS